MNIGAVTNQHPSSHCRREELTPWEPTVLLIIRHSRQQEPEKGDELEQGRGVMGGEEY